MREEHEHQAGILPGAYLIPRGMLEAKLIGMTVCQDKPQPLDWLAEQNILLYCRTGGRSALAAHSLQEMGFTKVFSLQGGFDEWFMLGYPLTVKES